MKKAMSCFLPDGAGTAKSLPLMFVAFGGQRDGLVPHLAMSPRFSALRGQSSFRVCGGAPGSYRSASAALTKVGAAVGWLHRWIAAALRRRSGFPWVAGPPVLPKCLSDTPDAVERSP